MRKSALVLLLGLAVALVPPPAAWAKKKVEEKKATEEKKPDLLSAGTFSGLAFRNIGPALTSGRLVDIAVHPEDPKIWYVAAASGGLWKTTNSGTTWAPVFEGQSVFSIGVVVIDEKNPNVLWVGTGENNSQRSVSWGDGVYKSLDGGASWTHVGLKASEHIGKIVIDPRDSDVVYVAAQGPLWGPGGDRGLYKTTDGGKTWKAILTICEYTGVSDLVFDPRDPDVLYAVAYQRRRHQWTLINGGPESAIHKSTDGGATWEKTTNGLPGGDLGRIGLAISPVDPDVLYATVEATRGNGGFYRSTNRGASWEKRNSWVASSPQYYQELFADPKNVDRVYGMDVLVQVTEDGGATIQRLGEKAKHVDNHALWIDPNDTDHLLVGCDGGLYETFDRGQTYRFFENLPITQFYRVEVSNDVPFYYVYGGTQDNYSMGGPSRSRNGNGIGNEDWFITLGGDGFTTRVDPVEPNILYAQYQHGGLVRFDRKSGDTVDIQPQPAPGEPALRWHWDSPLLISPHSRTRLYFAANRLFRSDDRGDSWRAVSPDLSRQLDRNKFKVMGKVWPLDTVAKNASTSFFGNIVAFSESPKVEGLLYVGTDDGLVQVSENGGGTWRREEKFPGVPDMTYVADLEASAHHADTVYLTFDNHKMADFKPYLFRSKDRGKTWTSISGDLPATSPAYTIAEDPVNPDLLFAGTEFGVYFTRDGGQKWIQLKGGIPPISIRDIAIQKRENDLVLASFGRGFFILDDYTPLRLADLATLEKDSHLFPVKKAPLYLETNRIGDTQKGFMGETFYFAPNPPFGATFTYYLREGIKTKKDQRKEAEKKVVDEKGDPSYPAWEDLRAEEREKAPEILLTVRDEDGQIVRHLTGPAATGFQRVTWDLRYPSFNPASAGGGSPFGPPPAGPLVAPGRYSVSMATVVDGQVTPLEGSQSFEVAALELTTLPPANRELLLAFQQKTARLARAAAGAAAAHGDIKERMALIFRALRDTPKADPTWSAEALRIERALLDLEVELSGDDTVSRRNEPTPPAIMDRVFRSTYGSWSASAPPTKTHEADYQYAAQAFGSWLERFTKLVEGDLATLEKKMEEALAPYTPGRIPRWKPE
ncbi:MAG: glycosyl hydrolase [Thermoanaerobaculia bacterium]|nr:glycosyl hydrolase [Thermoanaerobaculia bacterium]